MKKLFILTVALFSLSAVIGADVKGVLSNTPDGKMFYLYSYDGPRLVKVDSSKVKKGKLVFEIEDAEERGLYNIGSTEKNSVRFVFAGESITFEADGSDLANTFKVNDDGATALVSKYFKQYTSYDQISAEINQDYAKAARLQQFNPAEFENQKKAIIARWDSLQKQHNAFFGQLSKEHKDVAYINDLGAFFYMAADADAKSYLKNSDFDDSRWQHGDMLQRKINYYLTRFVPLSQQNIATEFHSILGMAKPQSRGKALTYEVLIQIGASIDQGYAKGLCKQAIREFPEVTKLQELKKMFPVDVGDEAPDIALPNPDGEIIKLSDLRGQVVLLDFWASWCGPCIRESPNVVAAYNKYKDKGFTVYGVSLDGNKSSWVAAIDKYGLIWPNHVSELKKWDSDPGRKYGVKGIPATFLIDENGVIIHKNLRGNSLHKTLGQLLDSK